MDLLTVERVNYDLALKEAYRFSGLVPCSCERNMYPRGCEVCWKQFFESNKSQGNYTAHLVHCLRVLCPESAGGVWEERILQAEPCGNVFRLKLARNHADCYYDIEVESDAAVTVSYDSHVICEEQEKITINFWPTFVMLWDDMSFESHKFFSVKCKACCFRNTIRCSSPKVTEYTAMLHSKDVPENLHAVLDNLVHPGIAAEIAKFCSNVQKLEIESRGYTLV